MAVLDAGRLQEFGHPRELLQKGPDVSAFAALYQSLTSKKDNDIDVAREGQAAEASKASSVSGSTEGEDM